MRKKIGIGFILLGVLLIVNFMINSTFQEYISYFQNKHFIINGTVDYVNTNATVINGTTSTTLIGYSFYADNKLMEASTYRSFFNNHAYSISEKIEIVYIKVPYIKSWINTPEQIHYEIYEVLIFDFAFIIYGFYLLIRIPLPESSLIDPE